MEYLTARLPTYSPAQREIGKKFNFIIFLILYQYFTVKQTVVGETMACAELNRPDMFM